MQAAYVRQIVRGVPGAGRVYRALRRLIRGRRLPEREDTRLRVLRRLPKRGVGMEIGVHLGDFSQRLLDETRPRELHLVDPWEHATDPTYAQAWFGGAADGGAEEMEARFASVGQRFSQAIEAGVVRLHRCYSHVALAGFPDAYFDWIYIDGNHTYEFVKQDLELSLCKVKPGGYVAGDDYGHAGWWEDGVRRAVDEVARDPAVRHFKVFRDQFVLRRR
jgi:hypothetical protein